MPHVLSVNIGRPMLQRIPRGRPTGIGKQPVDIIRVSDPGPKRVVDGAGVSGVAGDHVGDGRHHGGADQAVYAFAREELDAWERQLGRELPHGMFGENLTTLGIDVDAAEVGDRWRVGTAVLEVRGPRVPCATFGERMGERGWVRRFAAHGRSGAYLQVVEPGEIRPGDAITATPSGSGLTVPTYLRAWFGDPDAARTALDSGVLTGDRRAELKRVTARR
ncbi:MOSC domain-containing protein [Janibacter sp. DB-40]|uniref:MOSC domain-containing protein n=1 Tax=Janibacter sp. DB-40 TaxID=3028808 RepID=UPI002406496D|nr:MOSC domain-containing protein [Janibacter sp. DB-40]